MKRILLSAIMLAIPAGAFAADLPAKAITPAAPVASSLWSGFYAGALFGYGRGGADLTTTSDKLGFADLFPGEGTSHKPKGLISSLQFGYDWTKGSFVYGGYGSFGVSNFRSARYSRYNVYGGDNVGRDDDLFRTSANFRGSLGAKVGHVFDWGLIYAGAGVSMTKMKVSVLDNNIDSQGIDNHNNTGGGAQSKWRPGLELIAGVDVPVNDRVTIGGQYTWSKVSSASYKVAGASYDSGGNLYYQDINYVQKMHNYDNHIFGVSLKYRFN